MPKEPPTGSRAVIIGNGPSVDAVPTEQYHRWAGDHSCILIGTNRALCFVALQGVRLDAMVIRDTYRGLWRNQQLCCRYHNELWKPFPGRKVGPAATRVTWCDEFVTWGKGWQHEIVRDANHEYPVMSQSTVCLMAANWAWLHGARELAFVGLDYQPGRVAMIEPYESAPHKWAGQYRKAAAPEHIEGQFARARKAVESQGGSMVNLSEGSSLKALAQGATEVQYD